MSCLWASEMRKFEKIRLYLLPIRKLKAWQNVQNSYLPGTVHWTLLKNLAKNSCRWETVWEEPILSCGLFEVPLHIVPPFPWAHSAAKKGSEGHISAPVQCLSSDRLDCSAMPSSLAREGLLILPLFSGGERRECAGKLAWVRTWLASGS